MRRLTASVAAIGLVATGVVLTAGGQVSAAPVAPPANLAGLAVTPPPSDFDQLGAKKAIVTWGDYPTIDPTFPAFSVYRVVASRNADFITEGDPDYGPNGQGTTTVDTIPVVGEPLEAVADDLSAGKNYHFAVYAMNGNDVVSPTTVADTPIGYVLAGGYNVTITADRTTVLSKQPVVLTGRLSRPDGSGIKGQTITIFRDPYPKDDVEANTSTTEVTTTKGGRWTYTAKPLFNTRYWARYMPPSGIGGWTKTVAIDVRAQITLRVRPGTTISAGRTLSLLGEVNVKPSTVAGLKICWQSTAGGSWGGGQCSTIRDDGSYRFAFRPGPDADGKYRVYSGLGEFYGDAKSKAVTITIR